MDVRHSISALSAAWKFWRDGSAAPGAKVLFVLALLYVVFPLDLIPDIAPVIGWLDDLGVFALSALYLARVIGRYRTSLEQQAHVVETEGWEVR